MDVGLYSPQDTFAHRLHPAIKAGCLVLFFVIACSFTHPLFALLSVVGAILMVGAANARKAVARVWVFLVTIFAFSTILWTLFKHVGGDTAAGPLALNASSLLYGLGLGMRLDAMLVAGVVFLSCTTVEAFVAGLQACRTAFPVTLSIGAAYLVLAVAVGWDHTLAAALALFVGVAVECCVQPGRRLHAPFAVSGAWAVALLVSSLLAHWTVPLSLTLMFLLTLVVEGFVGELEGVGLPHPAIFALGLAFRLVPTLFATTNTVVQAQCSRGLALDSGPAWTRLRRHVPLLVPVLVATLRSTNLLAMALESRAFSPGAPRTSFLRSEPRFIDWVVLGAFLCVAALCVGLAQAGVGHLGAGG